MEFYVLGMVLVPLVLAIVSGVIERQMAEAEEEETLPLSQQSKAA